MNQDGIKELVTIVGGHLTVLDGKDGKIASVLMIVVLTRAAKDLLLERTIDRYERLRSVL